jgi:RNA polymerase sigma factor (sigma-70 family)
MIYDENFLALLRRRNQGAWTRFVYEFAPVLDTMFRSDGVNQSDIADLREETFIRVLVAIDGDRVRQPEQFGSYVRGTGKKVELEYFRKSGRYVPWPECHDPPARTPSIEDLLIEEEFQALLRIELSKLALKEQRLVEWVFAERRDRHDIARDLGITSSGVNVRLWKIYEKLRAAFHKRSKIAQIEETRSPSAAQGYRSNQRCQNKKRPPNTKKRLKETL